MNCLYTISLCDFGFAFSHTICVIVKDFGKALLKTKSSPIFFWYKLSRRKQSFEIANCPIRPRHDCSILEDRTAVNEQ